MAIVEMKKINLVAVTSDRKKLLRALQKLGCVQIEPVGGEEMKRWAISDDDELERTEQTLTRLKWAIGKLSKFDTAKKSLLAPRATAGDDEVAAALASMNESMETIDALEAIDRRHMEAKSEESRILTRIAQLNPYRALMEPLELIGQTRLTMAALGLMDARRVDETRAAIEEAGLAGRFDVVSTDKDGAHIFAVSPLDEWNKFNRVLKDSDFNQENFSEYTGTPAANIEKLKERINELRQSHAQTGRSGALDVRPAPAAQGAIRRDVARTRPRTRRYAAGGHQGGVHDDRLGSGRKRRRGGQASARGFAQTAWSNCSTRRMTKTRPRCLKIISSWPPISR